jgi:carbon storage regulator CsrA
MLVLARNERQEIKIGDDITIYVVEIDCFRHGKPRVRIGIEAPDSIAVDRGEVREAIERSGGKRRKSDA